MLPSPVPVALNPYCLVGDTTDAGNRFSSLTLDSNSGRKKAAEMQPYKQYTHVL